MHFPVNGSTVHEQIASGGELSDRERSSHVPRIECEDGPARQDQQARQEVKAADEVEPFADRAGSSLHLKREAQEGIVAPVR